MGECFYFNHSLGSLPYFIHQIRILGQVYHFSLLICYPYSLISKMRNKKEERDGNPNWMFLDKDDIHQNENKNKPFHEFCRPSHTVPNDGKPVDFLKLLFTDRLFN